MPVFLAIECTLEGTLHSLRLTRRMIDKAGLISPLMISGDFAENP